MQERRATPRENQEFQRRRRVSLLMSIGATLAAGLASMATLAILGDQGPGPKVAAGTALIAIFVLGQLASHMYFRCPVCSAPLPQVRKQVAPSQFFKGRCEKCNTEFPG